MSSNSDRPAGRDAGPGRLPQPPVSPDPRRRALLHGALMAGGAGVAGVGLGRLGVAVAGASGETSLSAPTPVTLRAASLTQPIGAHPVSGLMSYAADGPPPVLHARAGERFACDFQNALGEDSTVHWHGLRVPNAMDGVPWLTQLPVPDGKAHRYEFVTEDAGTYWYHPHCSTLEQMGRGLTGVFVVDERKPPPIDAEMVLNLRDFRLDDSGEFLPFSKPRAAARSGTLGTVMTVNWQVAPVLDAPAGGLVRLRLANTDVTRVYRLALTDGASDTPAGWTDARVIALDGHPLDAEALERVPAPAPGTALVLGAGQRADVIVRLPREEGQTLVLAHQLNGGQSVTLSTLRSVGHDAGRQLAEIGALPPNPIAVPDLQRAEVQDFVFGWSPDGDAPASATCGGYGMNFWSINRNAWTGDDPEPGAPLAMLDRGQSYVFRLRNETRYRHPIHLHGMTFRVLSSDRRKRLPRWTDTVLLDGNETVEIAFVADNPGDWVFHCHVIEHQKSGLAGYLRVA